MRYDGHALKFSGFAIFRHHQHSHLAAAQGAGALYRKQRAVQKSLLAIVAQADELLARLRQVARESAQLAKASVIGAPRFVQADEHLIGAGHERGIERVAANDARIAENAALDALACADRHRQADDRIVRRLSMHLFQHHVGLGVGEEAAALHRRQLRRIAEHQHLLAEGEKIAAEFLVDHRAFIDHDEFRTRGGAVVVENEGRLFGLRVGRAIDEAVNRARVLAALGAHDERRLAGEGCEGDVALDMFGKMPRERRFARSGVSEQPKHLPRAGRFKPARDGGQRLILFGRPDGHGYGVESRRHDGGADAGEQAPLSILSGAEARNQQRAAEREGDERKHGIALFICHSSENVAHRLRRQKERQETADQRDPADKRDERRGRVAPNVVADHNGETDREAYHADEGDGDGLARNALDHLQRHVPAHQHPGGHDQQRKRRSASREKA